MKILICEIFKDDHTSRPAGEKLRRMIVESTEKVVLDFKDVKIASSSFFDEGIAKLAFEGWDSSKIINRITFKNLFPMDERLLKEVCLKRKLNI